MLRKLLFSLTLVLAMMAVYSQAAFAAKYDFKSFYSCQNDAAWACESVQEAAKRWQDNERVDIRIVSHTIAFTPTGCAVLSIAYFVAE